MKVLHTEASCGWGGQEIRILEESRGLIERGHDIAVACPPHARMTQEATRYGVPVIPLPIEFKTLAGFVALRRHLAGGAYDVVNTHSSADSWLTALACATLPRPPAIVRTRHISAPVSGNFANRWLYRQARAVVTTGEALRRHLIDRLGLPANQVVSIPTGIDTARFCPPTDKVLAKRVVGLDPAHTHIGIVATLRSWKGHLDLLDAFARLDRPKLRLAIVGDGPQRAAIENRIAALNLAGKAMMTGQRDDPECWFRALDIFCLPSYANEGVPQALMQAMACGLPCVTTAVGAIGELVSHDETALVVSPHDPTSLADALHRLSDDGALSATLGKRARDFVAERHGRAVMLDRMEGLFRETTA